MNIIITGASRGIGRAVCNNLAARGGHHLLILSRSKEALSELEKELSLLDKKNKVSILAYDLTDSDIYSSIGNQVSSLVSKIDILINNAGSIVVKKFEDFTQTEIEQQFKVNYFAPAHLIQTFLPLLRKSDSPHIVNISSMGGFQGSKKFPGLSHYSASKAAIAALTESLAEEFKSEIAINALCLGAVQTEMLEEAFPGFRAPLKPEDMAEFIADFALNANKYLNGKVLPVSLNL